MNNLTTEQIARVFAMYLGAKSVGFKNNPFGKVGIRTDNDHISIHALIGANGKLLLSPLSAITDEDAVEVAKLCHADFIWSRVERIHYSFIVFGESTVGVKCKFQHWDDLSLEFAWLDGVPASQPEYHLAAKIFQYLVQRGYAVPLYIAPGHPDNGKTAIELGLAIEQQSLTQQP